MAELWFEEAAESALSDLEGDPRRRPLRDAVHAVLDQLERDPADPSMRRRRFQVGLWCVVVRADDEEWALLWDFEETDEVVVRYLGPASFA